MTNPVILVTGATGTVGSEVVKQLAEKQHTVRALVRDAAKAGQFGDAVEVVIGDLGQPKTLTDAFSGVETAFVLTPPVSNLAELESNAFAAARQAGVKRIVKLSNFGAGTFEGPPWQWHGASEARLRALGVDWTILRPTRFMTNTPYAWQPIQDRGEFVEAIGDGKVTLIDPRDIAAAAVTVLTTPGHDGQVYELTGEALTGNAIAQAIATAIGKPVTFVNASDEMAREALLASGFPPAAATMVIQTYATVRAGRWYPTSTLPSLLGRPARTYQEWLRDHADTLGAMTNRLHLAGTSS
jgi:uncharacterized protein YbjT (DUF2867 family)